jgi:hypothetical protein
MVIGEMLGVPEAERDEIRQLTDDMLHIEEGATGPSEQIPWVPYRVDQGDSWVELGVCGPDGCSSPIEAELRTAS